MLCKNCGNEIPDNSQFCSGCGAGVNTQNSHLAPVRHGFTSFWLIFVLVINIIALFIFIFNSGEMVELELISDGFSKMVIVLSVIGISGIVFLLNWKKTGFWIYAGVAVVSMFVNISGSGSFLESLMSLIGVGILWAVLNLKKNGTTTWEQLR